MELPLANLPATLSFAETVRKRVSVRAFTNEPIDAVTLHEILTEAGLAPSNCNTQPWNVHIVSGRSLAKLSSKLLEAHNANQWSSDFSFDTAAYSGRCSERQRSQGKAYHETLGIGRGDQLGRQATTAQNYTFFNAPHIALLFMPSVGDNVRVAGDIGMYGQTFLLALASRGLAGVPQTVIGMHAQTVREVLGIDAEHKLLFAISFGHADPEGQAKWYQQPRAPLSEIVTFHR